METDTIQSEPASVDSARAVRLERGEVIPGTRYRINEWLGEGAAGVVYECEHVDIGRRAALKILRAEIAPASRRAKLFREEARAVARARLTTGASSFQVASPYVVDVYDFGELDDGRLWFAMELLVGVSLDSELQTGPLKPERIVGILRQICKGLASAHEAGIVHRDVKPGNIMLLRQGGREDSVKLVDFGIAAMIGEDQNSSSRIVGTPQYMAPEQTKAGNFDARLDIYAVGCVAYHMLTGRPPFMGGTVREILRMHRDQTPVSPSAIADSAPVPSALETVVMKCLAKSPQDRYADMADLEAALCEAQVTAGIHTPWDDLPLPDVDPERRERLARDMPDLLGSTKPRSPWLLPGAAAIAVLIAGTGVVWWTAQPAEAPAAQSSVVDGLVDAAREAAAQAFFVYPPQNHPSAPTAYTKVLELEARTGDGSAAGAASQLRSEFAGTLVRLGDRYWDRPGGKPFALDYYVEALLFDPRHSRARERAPVTPGELADLRSKAATLGFSKAELRASAPLIALAEADEAERQRKLRTVIEASDELPVSTAARIESLAESEGMIIAARPKRAKSRQPTAEGDATPPVPAAVPEAVVPQAASPRDEAEKKAARRDPKRSQLLSSQGRKALRAADRKRAERLFNQALDLDSNNAQALDGLGRVHYDRSSYQRAVHFWKRAVARSPSNPQYRINLGDAYFKSFQYREARVQYEKAKARGHKAAQERLDKIGRKVGQPD